ncbi:MAG: VOC family protein [Pseudomonadota bacterium]
MALPIGPFVQIAYLVEDVHAAARHWADTLGAGPFFILEKIEPLCHSSGPPLTHSSAYGQLGSMMVELVQPLNGRQGVFDAPFNEVHHMAAFAPELSQALSACQAAQMPVAADAAFGETRFAFVDARQTMGHFIELYQHSADLEGFYGMIAGAAQGWDGADPVRPLAL